MLKRFTKLPVPKGWRVKCFLNENLWLMGWIDGWILCCEWLRAYWLGWKWAIFCLFLSSSFLLIRPLTGQTSSKPLWHRRWRIRCFGLLKQADQCYLWILILHNGLSISSQEQRRMTTKKIETDIQLRWELYIQYTYHWPFNHFWAVQHIIFLRKIIVQYFIYIHLEKNTNSVHKF